jgi:hypothetical protein
VSGNVVLDENTATGLAGASESGLVLTTSTGSLTNLLVRNNTVNDNSVTGIRVTAGPNSILNADNPNGASPVIGTTVQATGIVGNTVTNGGHGIEIISPSRMVTRRLLIPSMDSLPVLMELAASLISLCETIPSAVTSKTVLCCTT